MSFQEECGIGETKRKRTSLGGLPIQLERKPPLEGARGDEAQRDSDDRQTQQQCIGSHDEGRD